MKLQNKKTGQVGNFIINKDHFECVDLDYVPEYRNIAELNAEWEDYKEPKEYWFIDFNGEVKEFEVLGFEWQGWMKEIGNYFETKEEAQKAVEKLKAFKRLQDLGFRFEGIRFRDEHNYIEWKIKAKNELTDDEIEEFRDCLQKVFGGEYESNQ